MEPDGLNHVLIGQEDKEKSPELQNTDLRTEEASGRILEWESLECLGAEGKHRTFGREEGENFENAAWV